MVSNRSKNIGLSPTMKVSGEAKSMRAQGIDVINLSVGEPDFATPANIKNAGKKAIDENITTYTINSGLPKLKEAIIYRLKQDHNLNYKPDEIIVSSGAKHSLYNLCMAILDEGDEVIIPAPYWVSYPHMVKLADGVPVVVSAKEENGFRITPEEFQEAITTKTKAIMLNNPSNPTGGVYYKDQLEEIIKIAIENNLYIISDEIYEKLIYDDFKFYSAASFGDLAKKQTIIINGVSKAYAMTGWRIGYAVGAKEIIGAMGKIQSHSTSNACSISQYASIEAFTGPQDEIKKMVVEFEKRRNYMFERFEKIENVSCYKSQGAFYLFPNFSKYYNKSYEGKLLKDSEELCYYFLKKAHVAVVPGSAFGANDFIRFSYATSMELIEESMDRIERALSNLK